ncbi:Protein C46G7.1 [Aphelenchoides avenae]|nr:Protein C46G7.1 [Aphelenchus avenae]
MVLGKQCTACLLATSVWGVIFLAVLGALYKGRSVGLLEDLPEVEEVEWDERVKALNDMYDKNAMNCWIACGAYGVIVVLTAVRLFVCLK